MKRRIDVVGQSRRDFLKEVLVAGGALGVGLGSAVTLRVSGDAVSRGKDAKPGPAKRPGYRETEHVRTYYAKASL